MARRNTETDLNAFHAKLDELKLSFFREHYADVVQRAAQHQWDHLAVLEHLVDGEANRRRDRSVERRIRLARFPVKKTLESFDWTWPKNSNQLQVQNQFRLRFVQEAANVVFVGGVGLGKSHLVAERGYGGLTVARIDTLEIETVTFDRVESPSESHA